MRQLAIIYNPCLKYLIIPLLKRVLQSNSKTMKAGSQQKGIKYRIEPRLPLN